jgi:hypothetical protein
MRIGCLQFAPQVGDTDNNLSRADAVLSRADPEALDLLVLPEMAFSGKLTPVGFLSEDGSRLGPRLGADIYPIAPSYLAGTLRWSTRLTNAHQVITSDLYET